MSGSKRIKAVLAAVALGCSVLLAVWLLIRPAFVPEPPTHAQWLEAATLIKEQWKPGDAVRIEPFWLTAGRIYFGDLDGGKREPFRILDLHRTLDVPFLMTYQRVWLVSAVESAEQDWSEAMVGATLEDSWSLGALRVDLFLMPEEAIGLNLVKDLERVRVIRDRAGEPSPCKLNRGSGVFQCAVGGKYDVKVETREVAGGPRRCLLVRPMSDGAATRLEVDLPSQPGVFSLRFGNTMEAGRQKDGGTVTVDLAADDQPLQQVAIVRKDYDLHEVVVSVESGGPAVLSAEIRTPDERKREVCFDGFFVRSPWCDGDACRLEP